MGCTFEQTDRSRLRLYPEFGSYDQETIYSIIDEAPIVHVSAIYQSEPYIVPTVHWRIGNKIYIHGAVKNRAIQAIIYCSSACLSFTHFGGYVLSRSAFNHAVVYRSVTAFSKGKFITDLDERNELLRHFIERIEKGRWDEVRQPNENELKQTGILEFELDEVSAKILPEDITPVVFPGGEMEAPEDDLVSPWTGILPYELVKKDPVSSTTICEKFPMDDD